MAKSKAKNNTVTSSVSGTIPDIPGKIWRLRPYFLKKTLGFLGFLGFLTTPLEIPDVAS